MRIRIFFVLPLLVAIVALTSVCHGVSVNRDGMLVNWGSFPGSARDSYGTLLKGTTNAADLSQGALMQLIKAVGDIDDPRNNMPFYDDPDYTIDDEILQEAPIGAGCLYGPDGAWSARTEAPVLGDTVYVRAFNVPKPDFFVTPLMGREIGIRDADGNIISFTLDVNKPWTLTFSNLRTEIIPAPEPIPEPASLLFLLPGLAIWGLRRKK